MNDHERALAEYIVEMAKEVGIDEILVEDGVDFDLNDFTPEELDEDTINDDEPVYRVLLTGEGHKSVLERRAKRNPPGSAHPAEYRNEYPPLICEIMFRPERPMTTDEIEAVVRQE